MHPKLSYSIPASSANLRLSVLGQMRSVLPEAARLYSCRVSRLRRMPPPIAVSGLAGRGGRENLLGAAPRAPCAGQVHLTRSEGGVINGNPGVDHPGTFCGRDREADPAR